MEQTWNTSLSDITKLSKLSVLEKDWLEWNTYLSDITKLSWRRFGLNGTHP